MPSRCPQVGFESQGFPFVHGLATGDLVKVVHNINDHRDWVTECIQESDHWTARIVLFAGGSGVARVLPGEVRRQFESLGCAVYESPSRIVAIDIPAEIDPEVIVAALEKGQDAGAWDFDIGVSPPGWRSP